MYWTEELNILTETVYPIKSHIDNTILKYPLNPRILDTEFNPDVECSAFELVYKITQLNGSNLKPEGDAYKNYDVIIPLNTSCNYYVVNIAWLLYSSSMNILVIVFTGTYNKVLTLADTNYFQKDPTSLLNKIPNIKVHGGFWNLYSGIQEQLLLLFNEYSAKKPKVLITGYSLGGAISTLFMYDLHTRGNVDLDLIHCTFGSPRVFNTIGAKHYNSLKLNSYRVANLSDLVTSVPFPIMSSMPNPLNTEDFSHIKKLKHFDDNLGNYYDNHVMAYLKRYKLI